MKNLMDKHTIIRLKQQGKSNRQVAELMGINRKTVARYWNQFNENISKLEEQDADTALIQETIIGPPKYDSSSRKTIKYTKEIDKLLDEILSEEEKKNTLLGNHKQKLTYLQIHDLIRRAGHDISLATISAKIKEKRNKIKECFIRQLYDFGDRLEYDFGEVKLVIEGKTATYHMAVLSSPAANFRWAFLYTNQKKEAFLDSHIRFFEMVGGCYKEVVYDNMRNVVSKFIGKNEKELNPDLLILSNYYGYQINVTNCFKANEKGHVESSVKIVRNKIFANRYKFSSFEEASSYLQENLVKLNESSKIKEESEYLLPKRPKLEIGKITLQKVSSYAFVQVDKNFYSVPDYLVSCDVLIRSYVDKVKIYSNNQLVCTHKKVDGVNEVSIDIRHYLNSLTKKPGALRNSLALKSLPELKSIYDKHFIKNPRKFVELLVMHTDKSIEEIIDSFKAYEKISANITAIDSIPSQKIIDQKAKQQIEKYSLLYSSVGQGV